MRRRSRSSRRSASSTSGPRNRPGRGASTQRSRPGGSPGRGGFGFSDGRASGGGSEAAEVGGGDADPLLQAELLDHLAGGRDDEALARRDADAREDLGRVAALAVDAQDRDT